jgi:hypothetical protein
MQSFQVTGDFAELHCPHPLPLPEKRGDWDSAYSQHEKKSY